MVTWFDYLVETERRRDERARAAERRHLDHVLRSEQMKPRRRPHRHEILLASLGDRLVDWGCRLQTRYRHITETTAGIGPESLVTSRRADPSGCT